MQYFVIFFYFVRFISFVEEYASDLGYKPIKSFNVEELFTDSSMGETYWYHYNISPTKGTKYKASYEIYNRQREKVNQDYLTK